MAARKTQSRKKRKPAMQSDTTPFIRKALGKLRKGELVDLLVGIAQADGQVRRKLVQDLDVELPSSDLVSSTRQAIAAATEIDYDGLNHNFDYDSRAYEQIAKSFKKMITAGQWVEVMQLCVELMQHGSHQVECSDEGMMTDEICDCIRPVIKRARKSGLDPTALRTWCTEMLAADRVGFICREELTKMLEALASQ